MSEEQQVSVTGWDYKSIIEEARTLLEAEPELLKVACPKCGTPLDFARGIYHCPLGHYQSEDPSANQ